MNFQLTEEQMVVREAAAEFANEYLLSGVIERDEIQAFPTAQVKMMGELGFMGMQSAEEYGGSGMDNICYAIAIEEIAKIDASAAVIMSAHNSLVCWGLNAYGSDDQKEKYLKPLSSGEALGAFALSEPEAGSDATSQHTICEDKGDYFLLNGNKNWITNGGSAKYYLVFAQANRELGYKGINCLIVEQGMDGFAVGKKENKLGIRSSDTHALNFTDVKVPKENVLGGVGEGFHIAMAILNGGRIGIAAQALGIAAGAYEFAQAYAKERSTFGKPIIKHQAIGFKLADMKMQIEAARMLTYKAAWLKDNGMDYSEASAMAKLYASEVAMQVTTEAVQVHGGYGFVKEYHVERLMRDAKITQIYEGTSEIQRMVIARAIEKGN